jgi:hypothetical protein
MYIPPLEIEKKYRKIELLSKHNIDKEIKKLRQEIKPILNKGRNFSINLKITNPPMLINPHENKLTETDRKSTLDHVRKSFKLNSIENKFRPGIYVETSGKASERLSQNESKNQKDSNYKLNDSFILKNIIEENGEQKDINTIYNKIFSTRKLHLMRGNLGKKFESNYDQKKQNDSDEKMLDLKNKLYFMKSVYDFAYPLIMVEKVKTQKKIYEDYIEEMYKKAKSKNKLSNLNDGKLKNKKIPDKYLLIENFQKEILNQVGMEKTKDIKDKRLFITHQQFFNKNTLLKNKFNL